MIPFAKISKLTGAVFAAIALSAQATEAPKRVDVKQLSKKVEDVVVREGEPLRPFQEMTRIFIRPGYRFRVIDALVTNFHLPESTLLMLCAAFVGRDKLLAAYAHAVKADQAENNQPDHEHPCKNGVFNRGV